MQNTLTVDRGQNLFTTSTHTGHHYRPGYYFPSSNFKSVLNEPIPKSLNVKDEVLPDIHFQTTKNTYHDNKFPNQELYNDPLALRQTKPLPSYKVNYIADVVEKLNSKPRRPLTMGFQKSEYKEEFEEFENELNYQLDRPIHPKVYLDDDEKNVKLTQIAYDGNYKSDVPPKRPVDPSEIGVLNLLDPYLTSYNKEHKKWTNDQLKNIAKKDAMTLYTDDQMAKPNTYNKLANQKQTENMRDEIWFKSDTKLRQVHCPPKAVPHTGMKSEMKDMFTIPTDVKGREAKICPIETPFTLPQPSAKSAFATQGMYNSEYTNIGRGRIPQNQFK